MKNKQRYKIVFFFLFVLFVVSACKKEKQQNRDKDFYCYEMPPSVITWYVEERYQYKAPCFSPSNPNEFVYHYVDHKDRIRRLYKYNLLTKEKTLLVDGVNIIGRPKWGNKDWIAFSTLPDYQIWVVKTNGEGLKQISDVESINLSPLWRSDGEHLVYESALVFPSFEYTLQQNIFSNKIDTFFISRAGRLLFSDISRKDYLLRTGDVEGEHYYGYYDLGVNQGKLTQDNFTPTPFHPGQINVCWNPNSEEYYASHTQPNWSLLKINVHTKQVTKLLDFCLHNRYNVVSCSSDGKYLVAEKATRIYERDENFYFTGKVIESSKIVLLNLSTLEEKEVHLD